jgi:hypothetical protein
LGFNHQPQEKMMAENQPFEIHQQLRELAEENVEARVSFIFNSWMA